MAYTDRVIFACSVTVLLASIAYYWQTRKRRKLVVGKECGTQQVNVSVVSDSQSEQHQEDDQDLVVESILPESSEQETESSSVQVLSSTTESSLPTSSFDIITDSKVEVVEKMTADKSEKVSLTSTKPNLSNGKLDKTNTRDVQKVGENKTPEAVKANNKSATKSECANNNAVELKKTLITDTVVSKKSTVTNVDQSNVKKDKAVVLTAKTTTANEDTVDGGAGVGGGDDDALIEKTKKKKQPQKPKKKEAVLSSSARTASVDEVVVATSSSSQSTQSAPRSLSLSSALSSSGGVDKSSITTTTTTTVNTTQTDAGHRQSFAQVVLSSSSSSSSVSSLGTTKKLSSESKSVVVNSGDSDKTSVVAETVPIMKSNGKATVVGVTYSQVVTSSTSRTLSKTVSTETKTDDAECAKPTPLPSSTDVSTNGSANSMDEIETPPVWSNASNEPPIAPDNSNEEFGEHRSQGSNDSGRGGSDIYLNAKNKSSSSNGAVANSNDSAAAYPPMIYMDSGSGKVCCYFEIPSRLCGQFIGTHGSTVRLFMQNSKTRIVVMNDDPASPIRVCQIIGFKQNIECALAMIRQRFPLQSHPNFLMTPLNVQPPLISLKPSCHLTLTPGILTEAIISSIVSGGHFFVQQPTHPTYSQLPELDMCMAQHYNTTSAPTLPDVYIGVICAAPQADGWYRAAIVSILDDKVHVVIRFLDHGGYKFDVPLATLRQIHQNFLSLPFQAIECSLEDVEPIDPSGNWSPEAFSFMEKVQQSVVFVNWSGVINDYGVATVKVSKIDNSLHSIGQEMVELGLARWSTDVPQQASASNVEPVEQVPVALNAEAENQ